MILEAPVVLAGAGAIAAPIVIHLLNKRRTRTVHWGAMRFLLETVRQNQRKFQLEQLLLLLLRCALVILLALAFARPVLNPGGTGEGGASGPTIAVILLDQSASMGQSNGVQTRLEQAKAAAGKILDNLRPGSQAALLLLANRVNPVVPRPTANLPLVRRALELAEGTARTNDFAGGIKLALDTLKPISGADKEVFLLTDNQATAWQNIDAIQSALADSPEIKLHVVGLGEHGEENHAITSLRPETAVPAAGQAFGCLVEVSNFASTPANAVRVTLSVDDGPPVDETMIERIEPNQARTVRLSARLPKTGYYTLNAAIPADRLPIDDRRSLAVHVIDRVDMAVVEGGTTANRQDRDAFFLTNALAPISPTRRADYYLKVETVQPPWLASADLSRYQVLFLSDVAAPGAAATQKLLRYVQGGGNLVVFPGGRVQPDGYNNDPALRELLPARLGPRQDLSREGKFLAWQGKDYRHPVTALWNDPANGNLGTVRAFQYFPLTLNATPTQGPTTPRVVVAYTDGTPAVAERTVGKGRVILFSVPATTKGSNLPIHPDFVPFLKRLTNYLSPDADASSLLVAPGAAFQKTVNSELAGREVSVVRPGGVARSAGKVELVGQEAVIRYRDTEQPGGYRLKVAGDEGTTAAFAVQVDPAESDLRTVDPERIAVLTKEAKPGPNAATNGNATADTGRQNGGGVRRELWGALLACAGLLALGELLLANKLSVSR